MKKVRIHTAVGLVVIVLCTFAFAQLIRFFEDPDKTMNGGAGVYWLIAALACLVATVVILMVALVRFAMYNKKKNPGKALRTLLTADLDDSYEDERERVISVKAAHHANMVWQVITLVGVGLYIFASALYMPLSVVFLVYVLAAAFAGMQITSLVVWEKEYR